MKIAIKVITEWDIENVIPFFEKHYPNYNDCNPYKSGDVEEGEIWYIEEYSRSLTYYNKRYDNLSDYIILQGVPKDFELPPLEPTKTREQELEECLSRLIEYDKKYPTGRIYRYSDADKMCAELDKVIHQAKQLLNK